MRGTDSLMGSDKKDISAKKILVAISSSGEYPFVEIEELAQAQTFGRTNSPEVRILWVEGDPDLAHELRFRFLNALVGLVHRNLYGPTFQVSMDGFLPKIRLNIKSFFDRFYEPRRSRNGFSRLLRKLAGPAKTAQVREDGARVRLGFPSSYFLVPLRNIEKFRYLVSLDFDYLLSTTSTCYVDVRRLEAHVSALPAEKVYAGPKMNFGGAFVPGNHILMSRDVVQSVLELSEFIRLDVPDDVGIGQLVRDFGLADLRDTPTIDVEVGGAVPAALSGTLSESYLYRCKAEPRTVSAAPVITLMRNLHEAIDSMG